MTEPAHQQPHPDVEVLGAFVEGALDARRRQEVLEHLDHCADCMTTFELAAETVREEAGRRRWSRLAPVAAAAAIAAALFAVPTLRQAITGRFRPEPMARLIAATPPAERTVEPRLSGGFPWAKYSSPVRNPSGTATDPARLELYGAAGDVLSRAARDRGDEASHAAGVALVLIDRPEEAIARLQALAERSPNAARVHSDLAAALYSTALRLGRASLYPQALAAADRALQLDPQMAEALFNRALVLERMGLTAEARRVWQQYLAVDGSSPWANEARTHLGRLPAQPDSSLFLESLPDLERSAAANDLPAIRAAVVRFPQQTRTWAEAELLGQWAEGDPRTAAAKLQVARRIGAALAETTGERLLADAVHAIDSGDARRRVSLAEGHAVYRQGRMTYSRRSPAEAEPLLRRAAERLEKGGSPMALVARYFAANTTFDQNRVADAKGQLELLREVVPQQYAALHAQIGWELGLCHIAGGAWSDAMRILADAAARFDRLGETSNAAFVHSLKAESLASLGRPNESWSAWIAAFGKLSGQGTNDRLLVALDAAARMEIDAHRYDTALAMLRVEAAQARDGGDPAQLAMSLVRQLLVSEKSGRHGDAAAGLAEVLRAVARIADPGVRERVAADVRFASGVVALRSDAVRAKRELTEAIEAYESGERPIFLPEAYLQRGLANAKSGDPGAALDDLDRGMAALERQGPAISNGILESGRMLFEEAIRISLERGDPARAFAYAERQRGAANTVAGLQQLLTGSGTAVLELVMLEREVVAFIVTESSFSATRTAAARKDVDALIERRALPELHDLLIAPSHQHFGAARGLTVVAGRALEGVPFAALYDAKEGRYLIERFPVAMAASAGSLQTWAATRSQSVAVVALSAGEGSVALGEVAGELQGVASLYRRASMLDGPALPAFVEAARGADVVHLAGHAERTVSGSIDPVLTFAPNERVSWREMARQRLSSAVVVLAACDTLRSSASDPAGHSIATGFLTAGVGDVIGTLGPIEDAAAQELFLEIHRHLAAGDAAAVAVRKTQLRSLTVNGRKPGAWCDIASITTRIQR